MKIVHGYDAIRRKGHIWRNTRWGCWWWLNFLILIIVFCVYNTFRRMEQKIEWLHWFCFHLCTKRTLLCRAPLRCPRSLPKDIFEKLGHRDVLCLCLRTSLTTVWTLLLLREHFYAEPLEDVLGHCPRTSSRNSGIEMSYVFNFCPKKIIWKFWWYGFKSMSNLLKFSILNLNSFNIVKFENNR